MRVPKTHHYDTSEKITRVHLDAPIVIPRLPVITNDRQRVKLIKTIETYVRSSLEYKDLIKYLKDYIDMNQCEFFQNFDGSQKPGLIQIHHEPFDLFSITQIVMNRQEKELGYINELQVAEEVMRLHYEGKVGLVPLSTTVHQLYHRGDIFIPLQYVDRGFLAFYHEYKAYMTEYIEMLNRLVNMSSKYEASSNNILQKHLIYLDTMGYNQKPQKIF